MIKLTVVLEDDTEIDVESGFISFNDDNTITFLKRHTIPIESITKKCIEVQHIMFKTI